MSINYDLDLQSYFTDMEHLRGMFAEYVSASTLPKRLMVFHGVGGVGKSSLLRMFRLHCKNEKIPVGLASGDDAKSVLEVITRWTEDLKTDGIKFPALSKTLEAYRAIQAKVEDQVKKSQNKVADIASKVASKTAEVAGGALLGAALGSIIPGLGTIAGAVSGMGAEALTDWLRGFLSKPDIDLLLDPAKKLSADFLEDLAKAAGKKRLVLLLDTFEQMSALEDWVGEAAQKLHPNVLMVIAGRKLPGWDRVWPGWMMNAQVEELKPMTEEVMRALIHRYYATMRGGEPAPAQVEAIIRFARGLPMVVTSAVQLWVKYGVEDFQSVKAEIVANLVDRLMEGVPGNLIPALEAAAVVRWFDQPILRAVMNLEDVRDVYNELRRFPFVRTRIEGLALHDSVREMLDENLRVQDSERHAELHERAAVYFEKRLEKATGEEAERLGLERLYHRVRADEEEGIKLFQEMAEELTRHRFANRLGVLLNDVGSYPLEQENSKMWREYYSAWQNHMRGRLTDAERIHNIIMNTNIVEPKLMAYAMCSFGNLISRWHRLGEKEQPQKVIYLLGTSLGLVPLDVYLVTAMHRIAHVYRYQANWERALSYLYKLVQFYQEHDDIYGAIDTYTKIREVHAQKGAWREMLDVHKQCTELMSNLPKYSFLRHRVLGWLAWAWVFIGRYSESEKNVKEALDIASVEGLSLSVPNYSMRLGLLLGSQNKFSESRDCFQKTFDNLKNIGGDYMTFGAYAQGFQGMILTKQGKWESAEKNLSESLTISQQYRLSPDIPQIFVWLGQLSEVQKQLDISLEWYTRCIELQWTGRVNFHCESLTGLVRVKHAQGDIAAIPPLLAEAEQLAQQYEYNDHLASLRLTQGHLAWESGNQDEALVFYQQAMTYALRYNRFLLDELVSGRPQGTPLRPIVPACLERGEAGKTMLLALRDWWKTGVNDIGAPRPDTISPIPEGLALLEAEKMAREREPGDGSAQKSVVEQLEAAL